MSFIKIVREVPSLSGAKGGEGPGCISSPVPCYSLVSVRKSGRNRPSKWACREDVHKGKVLREMSPTGLKSFVILRFFRSYLQSQEWGAKV